MGTCVRTLAGHTGGVKAMALTKDGSKVVSGSDDKSFRVWNAGDGKPLLTIPNLAGERRRRRRGGQQHDGGGWAGERRR